MIEQLLKNTVGKDVNNIEHILSTPNEAVKITSENPKDCFLLLERIAYSYQQLLSENGQQLAYTAREVIKQLIHDHLNPPSVPDPTITYKEEIEILRFQLKTANENIAKLKKKKR